MKNEFLEELKRLLSSLPAGEIEKQVSYYSELLDDMVEDGMSEAQAVEKLGPPREIADSILSETAVPPAGEPRTRPRGLSVISIVLLVLGFPLWFPLLVAFFAVLLAVYIVIWAVVLVLFAAALSVAVCTLAFFVLFFLRLGTGLPGALMLLGTAIVCAGLTIPVYFVALYAAKLIIRVSVAIARWVRSLFVRKERKK